MHRNATPKAKTTKVNTPFKLSDLVNSIEFQKLRAHIDAKDRLRKDTGYKRSDIMKQLLAHWVLDQITKNYSDGIAILTCLSVANQLIKEMYQTPSPLVGAFFPKDPKDFTPEDMQTSCATRISPVEITNLYSNFSRFLDQRLSLANGQPLSLDLVRKNLKKDKLSKKIVNLYKIVATTQELKQQEVKDVPARASTPVVPQTPIARQPHNIQTFSEYIELGKFFMGRKHKMFSTTGMLDSGITKKDVFEYMLSNWIISIIQSGNASDRTSLQAMLRIAFEAAEGINKENTRNDIFDHINAMMQQSLNKGPLLSGNSAATISEIHVLVNYSMPYLQNKLIERLARNESVIDSLKGNTDLSKLIGNLLLASDTIRPIVAESKIPALPLEVDMNAGSPRSTETITGLAEFKKLQQFLHHFSIKMQGIHYPVTQSDVLNYLTLYWVVNLMQRPEFINSKISLLSLLEIAYDFNQKISQVEKRTMLLGNLSPMPTLKDHEKLAPGGYADRAVYLSEMHALMLRYPHHLTRTLQNSLRHAEEYKEVTLNPMPEMNEVSIPQCQNDIKQILAKLHLTVKKMEFKEEARAELQEPLRLQEALVRDTQLQSPQPSSSSEEVKIPATSTSHRRDSSPPPPPPPEEEVENASKFIAVPALAHIDEDEEPIMLGPIVRQLAVVSTQVPTPARQAGAPPPPPPPRVLVETPLSSSPSALFANAASEAKKEPKSASVVKENEKTAGGSGNKKQPPPPPPPAPF